MTNSSLPVPTGPQSETLSLPSALPHRDPAVGGEAHVVKPGRLIKGVYMGRKRVERGHI